MNHVAEEDVTVLLNVWAGDDPRSLQQCLQSVFGQIGVKISLFIILDSPITKDLREVITQCEKLANPLFSVTLVLNTQLTHQRILNCNVLGSSLAKFDSIT